MSSVPTTIGDFFFFQVPEPKNDKVYWPHTPKPHEEFYIS